MEFLSFRNGRRDAQITVLTKGNGLKLFYFVSFAFMIPKKKVQSICRRWQGHRNS